jgi:hypothetical protein
LVVNRIQLVVWALALLGWVAPVRAQYRPQAALWGEFVWNVPVQPNHPLRVFGEWGARTNQQQLIYSVSLQRKAWSAGVRNFSSRPDSTAGRRLEIRPYVGYLATVPAVGADWTVLARAEWRFYTTAADRLRLRLLLKPVRSPFYAEALWTAPSFAPDGSGFFRMRVGATFSPFAQATTLPTPTGTASSASSPGVPWRAEFIPLVEFGGGGTPALWTLRVRLRYDGR